MRLHPCALDGFNGRYGASRSLFGRAAAHNPHGAPQRALRVHPRGPNGVPDG
jgi:hypothetical protein